MRKPAAKTARDREDRNATGEAFSFAEHRRRTGEAHPGAGDPLRQRAAEDHLAPEVGAVERRQHGAVDGEVDLLLGEAAARHQLGRGDAGEVDDVHVAEGGAGLDERRAAAVDDGDAPARPAQLAAADDLGRPAVVAAREDGVGALADLFESAGFVGFRERCRDGFGGLGHR